jgi:hypothetical protein
MGRFDALTQIEEPAKPPAAPASAMQPETKPATPRPAKPKNPEFMNSGKPEKASPPRSLTEKPEKYSTLMKPELTKKIKLYAAQRDIKDYAVIELALTEYFQKHK